MNKREMKQFDPEEYVKTHPQIVIVHIYNGLINAVITKDNQKYMVLEQDEYIEEPQCPICFKPLENYCCSDCKYDFIDVLEP